MKFHISGLRGITCGGLWNDGRCAIFGGFGCAHAGGPINVQQDFQTIQYKNN